LAVILNATATTILRLRWAACKLKHPSERHFGPKQTKKGVQGRYKPDFEGHQLPRSRLRNYEPAGELDFQELQLIREIVKTFRNNLGLELPYPSEAHWFYQRCREHAFRSAADPEGKDLEVMKANTRRLERLEPDDNPFRDAGDKPALALLMQCALMDRRDWQPNEIDSCFQRVLKARKRLTEHLRKSNLTPMGIDEKGLYLKSKRGKDRAVDPYKRANTAEFKQDLEARKRRGRRQRRHHSQQ